MRVLLVEDDWDVAESMVELLGVLGHRIRVAYDGVSALQVASVERPDVMLVDIGLPGIDGYEVAKRARQDPNLQRTVLVALSGYGREEDKREAAAAGFHHHLTKPVAFDQLQEIVSRLQRHADASQSRPFGS
jgi:two-component system CheB/CheR fusion protein